MLVWCAKKFIMQKLRDANSHVAHVLYFALVGMLWAHLVTRFGWLAWVLCSDVFNVVGHPKARQTHRHAVVSNEEGGGVNLSNSDHLQVTGCADNWGKLP